VARSDALLASLVLAAKAHRALGQRERVNALLPRILAARARGEVLSAAP
jgi:hypothetical protein